MSSAVLLAAVVPFLVLVFCSGLLVGARTYATVRAGLAAEAAAGAMAAGDDPEEAARRSLSRRLLQEAQVRLVGDRVAVRVQALDPWSWGPSWAQVEMSAPIPGGGSS